MRLTIHRDRVLEVVKAIRGKPRFDAVSRRLRESCRNQDGELIVIEDVDPRGAKILADEIGGEIGICISRQATAAMADYD